MTEKQIIERLILDLECDVNDLNANTYHFIQQLGKKGYKIYPEFNNQTKEDMEEIKELLKMNP